jgi:hypothetical protein
VATTPTLEERNQKLDALEKAVTDYAKAQREYLNGQVARNKQILKGRTGSERLANASVEASTALTVASINDFLTGG